jgi:hypothetical protein
MSKSVSFVLCLAAAAGTAMADRPTAVMGPMMYGTASGLQAEGRPFEGNARNIIAEYNFATGALDIRPTAFAPQIISVNPSLANLQVLAIEAIGIGATVYHNQGATFENWASEMRLGLRIMLNNTETTGGAAPFPGVNNGPTGQQGSSAPYTGGAFGPIDVSAAGWTTPASGFSVAGWTTYNDGSGGLPSHTVTDGILRVTLVPSPGSAALLAMGGIVAIRRRRR